MDMNDYDSKREYINATRTDGSLTDVIDKR